MIICRQIHCTVVMEGFKILVFPTITSLFLILSHFCLSVTVHASCLQIYVANLAEQLPAVQFCFRKCPIVSVSSQSAAKRTMKVDTYAIISHLAHSLYFIHALLSQSTPTPLTQPASPPPSSPDTSNLSKTPSVSPPLSLIHPAPPLPPAVPQAVTAPSHVCQSKLAHLLLHTDTAHHAHWQHTHTHLPVRYSPQEMEGGRRPRLCL